MVTPGGGTTGPVGGYPGQSYYEDEGPGYQQRDERPGESADGAERAAEAGEVRSGGGFPGQDAYESGQFGTSGPGGDSAGGASGGDSAGGASGGDDFAAGITAGRGESLEDRAGYGPAPGADEGGYGRMAGFMNGDDGRESSDADESLGDESRNL